MFENLEVPEFRSVFIFKPIKSELNWNKKNVLSYKSLIITATFKNDLFT